MKRIFFILWFLTAGFWAHTQNSCGNIGFEQGDFSGWVGETGFTSLGPNPVFPSYCVPQAQWTGGFITGPQNEPSTCINPISAQHVLYNNPTQLDSMLQDSCFTVVSPFGQSYSARMGNHEANNGAVALEYSFVVDSTFSGVVYSYALVLQEAHFCTETPGFCVGFFDANDQLLPGPCGSYCVASFTADPNFQTFQMSTCAFGFYYKCWTSVAVDLSAYVGQTITMRYEMYDCIYGAHYGYAYVDAICQKMSVDVSFCPNATQAVLHAPGFFDSYQWLDHNMTPLSGETGQVLTINNPVPGDTFYVELLSASGCPATVMAVLDHPFTATATAGGVSCYGMSDGTLNVNTSNGLAPFSYSWNTVPATSAQTVSGVSAGQYTVIVTDSLGCIDSSLAIVSSPVLRDTLPQQVLMCDGDVLAAFSAPGGMYNYQWLDGNGTALSGASGSSLVLCAECPPDQTNPLDTLVVNVLQPAQYYVTWTPANGPVGPGNCPMRSPMILAYNSSPSFSSHDSIVNIFTPNGDGSNDLFYAYKSATWSPADFEFYSREYSLKVYNRWGELLFETSDYSIGWDGKKNGAPIAEGVYYWTAVYTSRCQKDMKSEEHGFVHLAR